jgi:hypothetical protein
MRLTVLAAPAALALGAGLAGLAAAAGPSAVPYPEGYRSWDHVKSMVILPGHPLENPFAGIHHVYANEAAGRGLASGEYADGAVLVFDLLAAKEDGKAFVEGDRKLVGVMRRDAKAYAATGGWGYEGFAGDSREERLVGDGGASCFACHEQAKAAAYVFSRPRK